MARDGSPDRRQVGADQAVQRMSHHARRSPGRFAPLPLLVYWGNAATVFGTSPCLLGRAGRRLLSKRLGCRSPAGGGIDARTSVAVGLERLQWSCDGDVGQLLRRRCGSRTRSSRPAALHRHDQVDQTNSPASAFAQKEPSQFAAVARSLSTGAVCVGGEAGNAVAQGKRSRQPAPVGGRRSLRRGWTFARVSGLGPGRCDA